MASGNEQAGHSRLADQGTTLLAEPLVLWEVAGLLGLDRRGGEDGTECTDVGDYVVALCFIALYLVCCVGEWDCCVWFTCGELAYVIRLMLARTVTYRRHTPLQMAWRKSLGLHCPCASSSDPSSPDAQGQNLVATGYL